MKTGYKIVASLAGAALLVALVVTVSFSAFRQIDATAGARKDTQLFLNSTDDFLSALKDAETGQRGYSLTGDEAFLEPYLAVRESVSGRLDELRRLIISSASAKHLEAIAPLLDAKMVEMAQVIELTRSRDTTAVVAAVGSGHGKRLMDLIRAEVGSVIQIEEDALAQHEAEFQSSMRRLFAIMAAASLLTLLFALAFAYLIHRESRHRIENLIHLRTQHLLELQEETSRQLQQANTTLQISEEKLAVTLHSIGDAVVATDAQGRVTLLNPLAEQLTGWTQAQAANLPVEDIFHIIDRETRQPSAIPVKETLARGAKLGLADHTVLIARDGSECAIADSCAPIRDRDGQVTGAVLVFRDVSDEYAAEQALRDSAEKLRLFADNVPAMTVSFDENLRCVFANKRYTDFFGYSAAAIVGKHLREIVGEDVYSEIEGHFAQVLRGHPVTYERTRKLANGESCYLEIRLLPHFGDQGKVLGCFVVATDITEHKLTEERIQRVAHHDSLTGLPNRLLFNDRLEQAIGLAKRGSRQFALLYLDLDRFKPVNDTLGHTAGDELLQGVAARLRQQVRESDTAARIGGDEFTVILLDIGGRGQAEAVARKIIAAIAAPFPIGSQKHSVTIGTSIGIALYPADGRNADALVKAADAAMYSAKQAGSSLHACAA